MEQLSAKYGITTKLLVATGNRGKLLEYRRLLEALPLEVTWPEREGIHLHVEETGETMAENAILKARAYAEASGLITWADDSGLEVDALYGEPGVRSARYAGANASDEERCRLLLSNLQGVPWEERTARFRCVVALVGPSGGLHTTEGVCEGIITLEPRGEGGLRLRSPLLSTRPGTDYGRIIAAREERYQPPVARFPRNTRHPGRPVAVENRPSVSVTCFGICQEAPHLPRQT